MVCSGGIRFDTGGIRIDTVGIRTKTEEIWIRYFDIWLARFMKGNWRVREIKIRLKEIVDIISPWASAGEETLCDKVWKRRHWEPALSIFPTHSPSLLNIMLFVKHLYYFFYLCINCKSDQDIRIKCKTP